MREANGLDRAGAPSRRNHAGTSSGPVAVCLRVSNDLNTSCSVTAVVGCLGYSFSGGTV